jgi:hypothetical protein
MKKTMASRRHYPLLLLTGLVLHLLLTGCADTNNTAPEKASSDIDAGRKFVRAALDGKFDEAQQLLLADSLNLNYLEVAARSYEKLTAADKENYKGASIIIHESRSLDDSTSLLIFSNSFKNDKDTLRVVRKNDQWVVDLAYLFMQAAKNLPSGKIPHQDTLP